VTEDVLWKAYYDEYENGEFHAYYGYIDDILIAEIKPYELYNVELFYVSTYGDVPNITELSFRNVERAKRAVEENKEELYNLVYF